MPSRNAPCHCPSCKGAIKSAKVHRQHASLQVQLAASKLDWHQVYETAYQAATSNKDDNKGDNESDDKSTNSGCIPNDEISGNTLPLARPAKQLQVNSLDHMDEIDPDDGQEFAAGSQGDVGMPAPENSVGEDNVQVPLDNQNPNPGHDSDSDIYKKSNKSDSGDEEGDFRVQMEAMNVLDNPEPEPQEPNESDNDDDSNDIAPQTPAVRSCIEHVQIAQALIEEIAKATLDNGKLDSAATECLRNPDRNSVNLTDPDTRFSLDLYMSCTNVSEATYNSVHTSVLQWFPDTDIIKPKKSYLISAA